MRRVDPVPRLLIQPLIAVVLVSVSLTALPDRGRADPLVSVQVNHSAYAAIGVAGVEPATASLVVSPPPPPAIYTAPTYGFDARASTRAGSAALDLAYVAAGRYDGFWELGLIPGISLPALCSYRKPVGIYQT